MPKHNTRKKKRGGSVDSINTKTKTTATWKSFNEWLSDEDVYATLQKFKKRRFKVYYPIAIDFAKKDSNTCVFDGICNDSYATIAKNYDQIAIVFNTDTHDKPGSHWIAVFFDVKKSIFYFFDSVGAVAPRQIRNLFNRFKREAANEGKRLRFKSCSCQHQLSFTECGMYCIFFIILMSKSTTNFEKFKTRIPDEEMYKLRTKLFKKDS